MILVYSVMSYDPNLLTQAVSLLHTSCVFVAWTGTEGSEGQGTEGCNRRLWLEEKREEMSLLCVSVILGK